MQTTIKNPTIVSISILHQHTNKKMVSSTAKKEEDHGLIYDIKLSSVGPGHISGSDAIVDPGNIDLAMKLHYIRGVYYFEKQAFEGLNTQAIKAPTFPWLDLYPVTCGRFRRAESGRAFIKCNDCGVRFVEAKCGKTMEEWMEMKDVVMLEKMLVSDKFIGPEIAYSPPMYLQITRFKCGGTAVGLSWSHILGDAFSAIECINTLGRIASGSGPKQPINPVLALTKPINSNGPTKVLEDPLSVKRVDPVGDSWIYTTTCKMESFSFDISPPDLINLQSRLRVDGAFEALSAIIWQSIARIRGQDMEPRIVTICRRNLDDRAGEFALKNSQLVNVINANFSVVDASASELAALLMSRDAVDERVKIEEAMMRSNGLDDLVMYGANLSFVNLEEAKIYEFGYNEHKPIKASYRVDGIGENGVVIVFTNSDGGRSVMVTLPENEVTKLKLEFEGASHFFWRDQF